MVMCCVVLSGRSCSNLRRNTPSDSFLAKGRSPVKALSFMFSTQPNNEFGHSSKRRSRGPVMAAKKASEGEKQEEGKYKHTVDLPKTGFGMRANALTREPELQKLWDENQVFKRVSDSNNGGSFVLHDGPPYANGDLHMGHALNKILKDIINRYKSMDQEVRKELTPLKLRAKAAKFAKATVKKQMESFKRFGVWADWNNPYLTLDPEYEAAQVELLSSIEKEMVSNVQHTGEYGEGENKVWIGVSRAEGSKCERCWNYSGQVGSFSDHPTLCGRCFNVIVANPPQPAVAAVIS
ncbi:hypothetical protein F2Q70_00018542 [Brassica cretica]|uniref:Aminoacyl-tRNA synthetase class Ia domain-containing protein n=1 Tax=Brassica cretica TaxID=69181 RepID=A0A8S9I6W7_BRACR|nr:hypothetical protein F2Q70_00018542 [Brassica cretica]